MCITASMYKNLQVSNQKKKKKIFFVSSTFVRKHTCARTKTQHNIVRAVAMQAAGYLDTVHTMRVHTYYV